MKRCDFYSDTHPEAMKVWLDCIRKKTPGEKAADVFRITAMVMKLSEAGVRMLYPNADEREVFLRATARRFDRETMIRVYGWDPEADD